jgi:hypothetical protein
VDHDLAAPVDKHHEFEQVSRAIRTDDEPPVRVLADVFNREWVSDGVIDVEVVDAMSPS